MNKSFEKKRIIRNEMNNNIHKTNDTTDALTYTFTGNKNFCDLMKSLNIKETDNNINKENIQYLNKVEVFEFLIDIIKKYSYTKIKEEIIEKKNEKKQLENSINIFTSK